LRYPAYYIQIFSDGAVAQSLLSKGTFGTPLSIHWSQGVGVMMGVYASGGVSGQLPYVFCFIDWM